MATVMLWVFCPLAAAALIAGGVLLAIGHGSEAIAAGALTGGAAGAAILVLLLKWRPNANHKGDGHE